MIVSTEFYEALIVESTLDGKAHRQATVQDSYFGIQADAQTEGNDVFWRARCGQWFVTRARYTVSRFPDGLCPGCEA